MPVKKEQISHILMPEHLKLSDKEKKELFERYNISLRELPKIFKNDPALLGLDVKENDVVKILRKGSSENASVFYRGVINEQ